jgi:beta-lactamase superfamily II metal-dependent hydrolase
MIFSLDVRRARKGDCLLLHFGSRKEPGLALIDGGPRGVYRAHLKPRLSEIRTARALEAKQPLPLDLVMVSHVDDDHIQGLIDLTGELTASVQPPLVRVLSFWHNSFDDIIGHDPAELTSAFIAQFGAAALSGELPDEASLDSDEDEEVVRSALKVLASIEQGHRLRQDAEKLGFPRNPEFDEKLILATKKPVALGNGLAFTVAGPMKPELRALQRKHDQWLKERKKKKGGAQETLAAYVDKSVPNLASIVLLAEVDGKRMLLTGDARGDKILKGLELVGLLKPGESLHVDLLKVPHHGSSNNVDDDFFERVTADHYVFSGNGEHGNPERAAMEMLFRARKAAPFQIHLTYPVAQIDAMRRAEWEKQQAKEKKRQAAGAKTKPRPPWSAAKQSLGAFLTKTRLGNGRHVRIADAKKPHVIDLMDKLGY